MSQMRIERQGLWPRWRVEEGKKERRRKKVLECKRLADL